MINLNGWVVLAVLAILTGLYIMSTSNFVGLFKDGPKDGWYYQNLPPSKTIEARYDDAINEGCNGKYNDYACRQRAYIKAMKGNTFDKTDLICLPYVNDENKYYECLDAVYGNYLWADRYAGTPTYGGCVCDTSSGKSRSGLLTPSGCLCPEPRPLEDRTPHDGLDRPVR